jgi:DegV family protein with EDD domain
MEIARRRCLASKEFFYVDTLEYLRRGGRIGTATALLGNAFSIKPILTVQDGEIAPLAKIRGSQRALDKLLDLAVQHAGEQEVDIAVSGVTPSAREMTLVQQLRNRIPTLNDIMLTHIGTALTAHVGPGTLGITVAPVQ